MFRALRNQRGNIAIAMALAVVGLMSGITMALLAYKDTVDASYDFHGIQELHILRSELTRAQVVTQALDYSGDGFELPVKFIEVAGSHSRNIYRTRTKVIKANVSTGGGLYFTQGYNIKSLVKVNRGGGSTTLWGNRLSMVAKYGEKGIRRNSFAGYHYFTDTDESTNGTNVYFWGYDIIRGKVHSNSDIWIKQLGPNNSGWPTFLGPVYTAGVIRSFSGTPPYTQVFQAGYWEHVSPLEFNPTADLIRAHGAPVGYSSYDPNRILFVTVNGSSFNSYLGLVTNAGRDSAGVYPIYPPPTGNWLYRNTFTKYDTLWSAGPSGPCSGHSNIVYSKLWLRGNFQGPQTWCSVDTLYLADNIKLFDTQLGACPDGTIQGSIINTRDYVGIVSEKSILIQYGYRDPIDSLRYHPNCADDGVGIWIYAALCALGDGGGDSHKDGVFSFEYQHPHPSTPAVRINNILYDKIDLHRRHYPPTTTNPWPANIDLPWYNPLWPERFPIMERGTIHLWGSIAQRRRGFVHRNTYDSEYPNPSGIWDVPVDLCGGPSGATVTDPVLGFSMYGVNAQNTTGSGVGYAKDYNFDNRFSFVTPPDFPEVHVRGGLTPFESEAWSLKKPPSAF
ncbi:MAG TPA: hypothetical protein PLF50_04300 [Candidatus Cloacimonadota bacterium]|nr:hypothetical protein [Candidatus Cloacimonadota bacterium]